ncbi:GIY-YIG nuclease family protein [Kordiimonas gwangyangensis]|uniref:GIY-YIG nuclease family protein n=1 Tax=Kordiimonas gwangyangensis TaxID=288022 RepID=UPI0012DFB273|nr:GIY-YIG nuclease family protein [Kordiimonas gwangyangensis]
MNDEKMMTEGLAGPGVYILVQRHRQTTVIYVGKANYLEHRIREHLANYIGFKYALRKADPSPGTASEEYILTSPYREGFNQYNNLRQSLENAICEVEKMEFYYCCCDNRPGALHYDLSVKLGHEDFPPAAIIKELEAVLIRHIKNIAHPHQHPDDISLPISSDNFRLERPKGLFDVDLEHFGNWLSRTLG